MICSLPKEKRSDNERMIKFTSIEEGKTFHTKQIPPRNNRTHNSSYYDKEQKQNDKRRDTMTDDNSAYLEFNTELLIHFPSELAPSYTTLITISRPSLEEEEPMNPPSLSSSVLLLLSLLLLLLSLLLFSLSLRLLLLTSFAAVTVAAVLLASVVVGDGWILSSLEVLSFVLLSMIVASSLD